MLRTPHHAPMVLRPPECGCPRSRTGGPQSLHARCLYFMSHYARFRSERTLSWTHKRTSAPASGAFFKLQSQPFLLSVLSSSRHLSRLPSIGSFMSVKSLSKLAYEKHPPILKLVHVSLHQQIVRLLNHKRQSKEWESVPSFKC